MDNNYIIENDSPNIINLDQNLNTNENNIQTLSSVNPSNIPTQTETDDFVDSLPDWDLVPPYESVRRINRL